MCAAGRVGTAVAAGIACAENKESIGVTILRAASRAGKVTGASATGTRIAGTASRYRKHRRHRHRHRHRHSEKGR